MHVLPVGASPLAKDGQQEAGRNGGADNTGNIRTHGMHEQEVGRVGLLTLQIGNPGGHWHSGHTGRVDEGIDLSTGKLAHYLSAQQTATGGQNESTNTQNNDF